MKTSIPICAFALAAAVGLTGTSMAQPAPDNSSHPEMNGPMNHDGMQGGMQNGGMRDSGMQNGQANHGAMADGDHGGMMREHYHHHRHHHHWMKRHHHHHM